MAELTVRDKKLIQAAADGLSPEEMEIKFGIPAAQCLVQIKTILAQRDVWTEVERKQLLLHDLYELKAKIQEQNKNYIDEKQGGVLLKVVTTIDNILSNQGKISEEELTKVTETNAKAMVRLISSAWKYARELLESEYPEADSKKIEKRLYEGLQVAYLEITDD